MSQKPQHQIIFTQKSTKWQLIEWMRICANAAWAVGRGRAAGQGGQWCRRFPSLLRPSIQSPRPPQLLLQFPPLPLPPLLLLPSDRWLEQVEAAHRLTCTAPQSPLPQNCILSHHKQYFCQNLQKPDHIATRFFWWVNRVIKKAKQPFLGNQRGLFDIHHTRNSLHHHSLIFFTWTFLNSTFTFPCSLSFVSFFPFTF